MRLKVGDIAFAVAAVKATASRLASALVQAMKSCRSSRLKIRFFLTCWAFSAVVLTFKKVTFLFW